MTDSLCVRCHQPQAAHRRVVRRGEPDWNSLLVCPTATWQAPQELDVPVRHDTGTAEAVQGRTVERLHADSTPESLATQLAAMTAERDRARDQLAGCCACQHDGRGALTSECQEHQEQREAFAALRTALAQLVTEAKKTESFLESVEWTDTTAERDAADIQQALLTAISDADELDRLLREKETGR